MFDCREKKRMKKLSLLVSCIAVVNDCSFYSMHNCARPKLFPVPKIPLACYSVHDETIENHDLGQRKSESSSSFIERRKGRRVEVSLTDMTEPAGKAKLIALPVERTKCISKVHNKDPIASGKQFPVKSQSIDAKSHVYAGDELVPDTNPRVSNTQHLYASTFLFPVVLFLSDYPHNWQWYVLKVKAGKEGNVCDMIHKNIESWDLKETILKVVVPSRRVKRTVRKKLIAQDAPLLPGYVYMKVASPAL